MTGKPFYRISKNSRKTGIFLKSSVDRLKIIVYNIKVKSKGVAKMFEKISLAGDLGSGKSTVSDILVRLLDAEYYSTGAIVRDIADKRGLTVVELNKYMETHPEIDHEIDNRLKDLSDAPKRLIIDSRMAWHFTEGTFKVYLSTDATVSALRIMNANRKGEHNATLEETLKDTRERRESEKKRYLEQYGVNIKDLSNYSLIVDTTSATPDEIASCIKEGFERWLLDREYKRLYISPTRLFYPIDEADTELISRYVGDLESGGEIPSPTVFEDDGEFYLESGLEAAQVFSLFDYSLIPATLIKGEKRGEYVRMADSL